MKRSLHTLVYPSLMMAWLILAVGVYASSSTYDFVHVFIIPLDLPRVNLLAHVVLWRYLLDLVIALVGAGVFSLACLAAGLQLLRYRPSVPDSPIVVLPAAFLLGEILFSVIFLTCIVLYRLTPLMVWAAFVLALLTGGRQLLGFIRSQPRLHMPRGFTTAERAILAVTVVVLALAALYSSAVLGYDSVVQYFSQPKLLAMLQKPALTYVRDVYLVSSLHSEILSTAMIQTFGDQAARLISWLNGLVIVLVGLVIGELAGLTRRARLWFIGLMATSTAYVDLMGDGKIDLLSTAFALAAVYWTLRTVKAPSRTNFLMLGTFAGFAILARPFNILLTPVFMAAFFAIYFVQQWRAGESPDLGAFVRAGLWMLPPLLALGAFHLLQNWLWLGNPLAPLVDSPRLNTATWQWQFDPRLLNLFRVLYPLVVTFANSPQSLGNVTPFVVGFLPFLLFRRVRDGMRQYRDLLSLTLAALITLIIWLLAYFTVVEIRYALFLWVLFFLFTAQVIDIAASGLKLRAAVLLQPLLMFLLIYMGVRTVIIGLGSYAPVDRTGQAHCYFLDLCTFMDPLNQSAAPGERVFVVSAYRYYLRPDLFACASRAEEYGALQSLAKQNSPDFWTELYRAGFRYVTYESNFATFHSWFGTLPPMTPTPPWLQVSVLHANTEGVYGNQLVYQLQATQPPFLSQTYCMQDAAGIWQVQQVKPAGQE